MLRRILVVLVLAAPAAASAHIQLRYPTQRTTDQKQGPCGLAGSTRGDAVTTLRPGAELTVRWDETVDHPGHYRIAFDADGDDGFIPPVDLEQTFDNVLLDHIEDRAVSGTDRGYQARVTLPDIECDNCTLQLIQVMSTSPPFSSGDLYFQCADLVLDPRRAPWARRRNGRSSWWRRRGRGWMPDLAINHQAVRVGDPSLRHAGCCRSSQAKLTGICKTPTSQCVEIVARATNNRVDRWQQESPARATVGKNRSLTCGN